MRAFGYVRLSKDTEEATSPQRQRAKIEALCKDRGWVLLQTFEDIDESAFNGHKRPAYDQMLGRLDEAEAIVFWRPDRLARSVTDFSHLLDTCKERGVHLVSTDYQIDTSSAMGKAFVQLTAVFAELESGNLSERSRQMMAHKREKGEWVGRVPFGWTLVGKHLERNEDEQAVLQEIARRYVGGEAVYSIARDLGRASSVVSKILHSDRVIEALPDDLSGPLVEALVSRRRDRVPTSRKSLLGGIATCAICGGGLSLASSRGGRAEGRWYSYRCPPHVGIAGPWLENYVTEQVLDYIDVDKLQEAIKRRRQTGKTRKASEIEARLELLDAHYVEGKISKARFDRMNASLLAQLKEAQTVEWQRGVDLPVELARNLSENWAEMPVSTRRRIIAAVVESLTVAKATGHGPIDPKRVAVVWRV